MRERLEVNKSCESHDNLWRGLFTSCRNDFHGLIRSGGQENTFFPGWGNDVRFTWTKKTCNGFQFLSCHVFREEFIPAQNRGNARRRDECGPPKLDLRPRMDAPRFGWMNSLRKLINLMRFWNVREVFLELKDKNHYQFKIMLNRLRNRPMKKVWHLLSSNQRETDLLKSFLDTMNAIDAALENDSLPTIKLAITSPGEKKKSPGIKRKAMRLPIAAALNPPPPPEVPPVFADLTNRINDAEELQKRRRLDPAGATDGATDNDVVQAVIEESRVWIFSFPPTTYIELGCPRNWSSRSVCSNSCSFWCDWFFVERNSDLSCASDKCFCYSINWFPCSSSKHSRSSSSPISSHKRRIWWSSNSRLEPSPRSLQFTTWSKQWFGWKKKQIKIPFKNSILMNHFFQPPPPSANSDSSSVTHLSHSFAATRRETLGVISQCSWRWSWEWRFLKKMSVCSVSSLEMDREKSDQYLSLKKNEVLCGHHVDNKR